jgi:general secretion pathway protein C
MDTDWLAPASDKLNSGWAAVSLQVQRLWEPRQARRVKLCVYGLAVAWLLWTLAALTWGFLPPAQLDSSTGEVINPLQGGGGAAVRQPVKIEELAGWNLFGKLDVKAPAKAASQAQAGPANTATGDRAGIEDGARETRLSVVLQGIVASNQPAAARAIIEHQKKQEQYRVDDKLPVSGNVTVAKIMADRVVLSNSGKYELLLLFDEKSRSSQPMVSAQPARKPQLAVDRRKNRNVTEMAENYRKRLYTNPQSLADVVKISAVRVDGQLQGYRVSSGKDREQFKSMGFEANDIVTAVNGIELNDPGKAMELYKIMRSAEEASFNVRRGEEDMTLVVGLQAPAGDE